jgi:uncharacterized protein (TIGR04255 family)
MPEKYRKPPIIEALFQIEFDPTSKWDLAIPGIIYERVKDTFGKRQPIQHFSIIATATEAGLEQQVARTNRVQFLSEDGEALLQVGPNIVSVHRLQPYVSWENFLPAIKLGLSSYLELAEPKGVVRIELRYINQIVIPNERVELEDYFEFYPHVGPNLPQDYGAFVAGIQLAEPDIESALQLQLTSAASQQKGNLAFILDIGCSRQNNIEMSDAFLLEWLEAAHTLIETTFEGTLTESSRALFEEVK